MINGQIDGWVDETDGWINCGVDGWMDGWRNGQTDIRVDHWLLR